jgi:hypothetical protein
MRIEDMFSRRHGFHAPNTLWEDNLPPDFLPGLKNVLEVCFWKAGFQSTWVRLSNALGWPRNKPKEFVFAQDDYSLDEYESAAAERPWYETMDSIEVIAKDITDNKGADFANYREKINELFQLRDVNWVLDDTGKLVRRVENLAAIKQALNGTEPAAATSVEHLQKAWDLFNRRPIPDFANCVKEAVMAVESIVLTLSGQGKGTLTDALRKLNLHPALAQSLEKLYGYRGDEPGVAHGATALPDVSRPQAELVLTVCAALVTFLSQKPQSAVR